MQFAQAFSPGHVTGLFSIHDDDNPLRSGSLGAGFCLSDGVTSSVESRAEREDVYVFCGDPHAAVPVSKDVVRLFFKRIDEKRTRFFTFRQDTGLPIGCGFGTSGAGALSLALALNALHGDPLSFLEAAAVAHLAEIEAGTGLGTVIGETFGGFEIREAAGAPGTGRLRHFSYPKDLRAVFLVLGPLSTAAHLKNSAVKEKINLAGTKLRQELQNEPSVEQFLKSSHDFTQMTGLLPSRLKGVTETLARSGVVAPMLMFGEGLFTLVSPDRLPKVLESFQAFRGAGNVFSCTIDPEGGRVTDVR